MKLRLIKIRDALTESFWFVPALMAMIAAITALGSVALDNALGRDWVRDMGWVWSGGPDGARGVLATIAGSLMTVISIVFSLTITTLAQASSHFGPRILRNFTSDRGVQITLGTFIATFVYCLLVLKTIRSVEESEFVPHLSVNIGVLLALASLAILIFFIHHISQRVQAENLIADIGQEFKHALPVLFPKQLAIPLTNDERVTPSEAEWGQAAAVHATHAGYLQRVDETQLLRLAIQHDLVVKLIRRPGDFVDQQVPLLRLLPSSRMTDDLQSVLRACFSQGRHRTPHQDPLYCFQQLVEIAAHALSPGINEPFTAIACIDWLGAGLRAVAGTELPSPLRPDEQGQLRVIARPVSFEELARTAFDQIRIYGAADPEVLLRVAEVIGGLVPQLQRASDRDALLYHVRLVGADAKQIANESDRQRVRATLEEVLFALNGCDLPNP